MKAECESMLAVPLFRARAAMRDALRHRIVESSEGVGASVLFQTTPLTWRSFVEGLSDPSSNGCRFFDE